MFEETKNQQQPANLESALVEKGAALEIYSYVLGENVSFQAYLTSYSDSFTSNWQQENVYGRMDPIATFQNTQRRINVGFTVPNVVDREDASTMDKVNRFFRMLYPKYEGGNALTLSQAPLLRLKFANLIAKDGSSSGVVQSSGLLGYITNLSFQPKIEHGFSFVDDKMRPNFLDLSFEFSVLHENEGETYEDMFFKKSNFPYGEFAADETIQEEPATNTSDQVDVPDEPRSNVGVDDNIRELADTMAHINGDPTTAGIFSETP